MRTVGEMAHGLSFVYRLVSAKRVQMIVPVANGVLMRMRILVADDEALARKMLVGTIKEACADAEILAFATPSEALEIARGTPCDAAFLGVHTRGMNGLELAARLKEIITDVNIIFVADCDRYAIDAISMRASGYLIKPVTADMVRRELANLRHSTSQDARPLLNVHCFGAFEVYDAAGRSVYFKRSKAKETFAYLVHRQGASCTIRELAAVLFEDAPYDLKQQRYMQQIIFSMMQALKGVNAEKAVHKQYNSLSLDVSLIACDYYSFCRQPEAGEERFRGEYMSQYAWAEFMTGYLERRTADG